MPANWIEVRLADFYGPELAELGRREAKATLARITLGTHADCVAGKRSYDRVVALCRIGRASVGDSMKADGVEEGGNGRLSGRFGAISKYLRYRCPLVCGWTIMGLVELIAHR